MLQYLGLGVVGNDFRRNKCSVSSLHMLCKGEDKWEEHTDTRFSPAVPVEYWAMDLRIALHATEEAKPEHQPTIPHSILL